MSLWKRIRVYHYRWWKGCALHTIIFIFNISRTQTKNMLDETRLLNTLSLIAHVSNNANTYLEMKRARIWLKEKKRKKHQQYRKEFSEGLKSLITREICALKIKSVWRAIAEHFFSQFCIHWLFPPAFIRPETYRKTATKKKPETIFKQHSNNWC